MVDFKSFYEKSWALPVVILFVLVLGILYKTDVSLVNLIANKVIEKIDGDYSPYGQDR